MSTKCLRAKHSIALGLVSAATFAGAIANAAQHVAVPSYFDSGNAGWSTIQQDSPTVGTAVINPSNGIGADSEFTSYTQLVASKPAGLKLLGYVYTRYANTTTQGGDPDRTPAGIEANIERYYALLPGIDGIFLDEATNTCALEPYYSQIRAYMNVHHPGATLAINPGASVPQCYLNDADVIVTFEGQFSSYSDTKVNVSDDPNGPGGALNTNDAQFWHLIYNTSGASMATALAWSRVNHAGSVYVTDLGSATTPNPWGGLASYFSSEVSDVAANGGGGGPYSVTINALDLDNSNAQVAGLCVFIDGASQCAWTPVSVTLSAGSHDIAMTNYQTDIFDHWDNGSTSAARTVTLTANGTFNAYYHTH